VRVHIIERLQELTEETSRGRAAWREDSAPTYLY
jgi:hypothetical protein